MEIAIKIVRRLREAGHVAYFAGGCVRDMVRGVEPHDFDVATSATPEQIQNIFPRTVGVGAAFGVVLVLEGDQQFEVATFRCDEAYLDGRRPSGVHFGTPEEDAQRRDFTVNGMFFDPLGSKLIDFVGGEPDIERRIVRTIGEARHRFTEDKLRLLRCIRFATSLGYEIEPVTFATVREMASQIGVVSAERIRDELTKIFTRANPGRGLVLLEESGLLREVLPEAAAMKGVEQPAEFHPEGDVFEHTKLMLDAMPAVPSLTLAWAVLLHDVGKPPTFRVAERIRFDEHDVVGAKMSEEILRRLRFSNEEIERIVLCVAEHMRFRHVQEMRPAKVKRLLARPTFAEELELHRLDCIASHGSIENVEFLLKKAKEMPPEVVKPKPLVDGRDLLAMGFTPGKLVGAVLKEIEELQLEERLESREAALAYARDRLHASDSTGPAGNG
jgi:poly(A) polymerase